MPGTKSDHLFSADLTNGNVRDLTPFRGVRAQNILTDLQHPRFVLVALNLRDRQAFDMYRIDLETGAVTLEAQNPGDVLTWTTDNDFVIRGATAFDGKTAASIIRVRDAADKPWRDLVVMPFERALFAGEVVGGSLIAGFDPDGKSLVIHSALRSDKGRLVRVDLQTGKKSGVLAQDPQSDVANSGLGDGPNVLRDPVTHAIEAVEFNYTTSHWDFLDPKVRADFEIIGRDVSGFLDLISRDRADRKWIIAARRSDAPAIYYVFDREAKKLTKLYDECPALVKESLAPKKGVVIKARDGLSLPCYLTTPPGVEVEKSPDGPAHSRWPVVSRLRQFRPGGATARQPRLRGPAGELSRFDRIRTQVSQRRDWRMGARDAGRFVRRRKVGDRPGHRGSEAHRGDGLVRRRVRHPPRAGDAARSVRLRSRWCRSGRPGHALPLLSQVIGPTS